MSTCHIQFLIDPPNIEHNNSDFFHYTYILLRFPLFETADVQTLRSATRNNLKKRKLIKHTKRSTWFHNPIQKVFYLT